MKNDKGITLIALIITIIVMLILVGVTVNIAIGDGGLIQTTREAKEEYQIETEKEKAIGLVVDYYKAYGKELSEETLEEFAKLVIETGIDSSKLTLWYNFGSESTNEIDREIILYRIDKTTEEERTILEEKGIKSLRGDVTLDGFLTQDDIDLMIKCAAWQAELSELQIEIGTMYSTEEFAGAPEASYLISVFAGQNSYTGGYIR